MLSEIALYKHDTHEFSTQKLFLFMKPIPGNLLPLIVASKWCLEPGLKFNVSQEMTSTLYSPVDTVSDAMMTEAGDSITQAWQA